MATSKSSTTTILSLNVSTLPSEFQLCGSNDLIFSLILITLILNSYSYANLLRILIELGCNRQNDKYGSQNDGGIEKEFLDTSFSIITSESVPICGTKTASSVLQKNRNRQKHCDYYLGKG